MSKRKHKFKTEVQQLLDLVIHSLYSKKDIFLRELLSNASDAIDRRRFEALTNASVGQPGEDYRIRIHADAEAGTLTVSDNGIGMTEEEVDRHIGTIANSGTRRYLEALRESGGTVDQEFIGQFGVGFYASFMVADRVELVTKRAGSDSPAVRWSSDGGGSYMLEEAERKEPGTDVILHLRDDMKEYLQEWSIRQIVKQYSDYIAFPIVMDIIRKKDDKEETEEETLNSIKAIWRKSKDEISEDEYNEFYKHISHDHRDPLTRLHFFAEGVTEFRALVYIPGEAPYDLFLPQTPRGIHLYVKNVFITDDCRELAPEYLRFLRGVIDSSDLPLNVSREILQDDAVVRRIRKSLVGKVLNHLQDMKTKEYDKYLQFYRHFGRVLKEGLPADFENADKLKDLLVFHSLQTEGDRMISLADYVDAMPDGQKDIYYHMADNLEAARKSPLLEAFRKRGYDVLFWLDAVDEWIAPSLTEYRDRRLVNIDRGDVDFGDEDKEQREKSAASLKGLTDYLRKRHEDKLKEVRVSNRLTDSAGCLVLDEQAMNPSMRRMMEAMNQPVPDTQRIMEINPDHPIIQRMRAWHEQDKDDSRLANAADLLYYETLTAEGSPVDNPSHFAKLINDMILKVTS